VSSSFAYSFSFDVPRLTLRLPSFFLSFLHPFRCDENSYTLSYIIHQQAAVEASSSTSDQDRGGLMEIEA
jgi:hypothetical protein